MTRIGDTALLTACKKGDAEIARVMIDHGANVKHANASGVTPLMAAAYGGYDGIAALLLARGADESLKDNRGMTAKDIAAQTQSNQVANLLSVH
ncbi:hypothetical protein PTKU64_61370 [Paraburkholderia terrae]|uniref:Ankyrin repeat domain-containing protein n=1 Tax=Paraburkholderia terrae TaxID=311230 RepID=A0ABM7TTN3_9BURK|nr:hypothetical protein PTKU64_61370 [Paraburkholderia terrae]